MSEKTSVNKKYDQKIIWWKLIGQIFIHAGSLIGFYYLITGQCKILTYFWAFIIFILGGIGIGPAAHRLFSHRAYKVTPRFKIFMIFCQQIAGQASVFYWARVHRTHHKFTETDKDPTNINRSLFYAYIGWFFHTHTPEVQREMDRIEMQDLLDDKKLQFQYRHYEILFVLVTMLFPTIAPVLLWRESLWIAFWINVLRYTLNFTQLNIGNGLLHYNGLKPYDRNITAKESKIWIFCTLGEGYHNFHHVFPYDYRAAEFGGFFDCNLGAWIIDIFAYFGWVYDRKITTPEIIEKRVRRTGDGSHWSVEN